MRFRNTLGSICFLLPLFVVLTGIVTVSPDTGAEFDRICRDGSREVQHFKQFILGKCPLGE